MFRFNLLSSAVTPVLPLCAAGSLLGMAALSHAAEAIPISAVARATPVDFEEEVYPFLKDNCIACHNKTTTKAGLNMETPDLMLKGGDSGPSIVRGDGTGSLLIEAAAHTGDSPMPPKSNKVGAVNLTSEQIGLLKLWIDQGAKATPRKERQIAWEPLPPGLNPIYAVALSPDGAWAACARANQVSLYDLGTQTLVTRLTDPRLLQSGLYKQPGVAHRDVVQALAFSPDGQRLVSGGYREVNVWKRQAPAPRVIRPDPAWQITASALNTSGTRMVAATRDGRLLVTDTSSGKTLLSLPATPDAEPEASTAPLLAFSPDGSRFAQARGAALRVFATQDGKPVLVQDLTAAARALGWLRDSASVAVAGEDKVIRVWSLQTADKPVMELKGLASPVTAIAPGPGLQLLSGSEDGTVRFWDVAAASSLREIKHSGAIIALQVTPDGRRLATAGTDRSIKIWNPADGKMLTEIRADAEALRAVADGERILAATTLEIAWQNEAIKKAEQNVQTLMDRLKKAHELADLARKSLEDKRKDARTKADARAAAEKANQEAADLLAKAPQGKPNDVLAKRQKEAQDKLEKAGQDDKLAQEALKRAEAAITDTANEIQLVTKTKADGEKGVADAKAALAAATQAQTRATADVTAARKKADEALKPARGLAFSPDLTQLAAACDDGRVRVWRADNGAALKTTSISTQPLTGIAWAQPASLSLCAADATMATVPLQTSWTLERTLGSGDGHSPITDRANALRFSPDGKMLAIGSGEPSRSGDITLWEVANGRLAQSYAERHLDTVLSLDFSPDGKLLASGGADKAVRVTDLASGKVIKVFEGHTHHVLGLTWRSDGRLLASAGADGALKVWDWTTGDRRKNVDGWDKEVTGAQYLGALDQIVTSAGDNKVRIVNSDGGEVRLLPEVADFMQSVATNRNGDVIAAGGQDSILRVWNARDGKQLAAFSVPTGK